MSPIQSDMIVRMVLAIIQSGRWPSSEDLRNCVALSDEILGLGALLEAKSAIAPEAMSVAHWRKSRQGQPPTSSGMLPRPPRR